MKFLKITIVLLLTSFFSFAQKGYRQAAYKHMMDDMSINFYTVCDSAEAYFKTIDKDKKGSGYKPFLRWKNDNEFKYYPSGNRRIDHYLPFKEFERLKKGSKSHRTTAATLDWTLKGPALVGAITGHYAPGLGRMEYVEVNRNNAQQIYMGSRSGGLWRTNNEGTTWIHNTDFLPGSGVDAIAANPTNFDSVLINVKMADTGHSFGIYRSTDGGVTFQQTNFNPATLGFGGLGSNFKINMIRYHPTVANLVFVGTDRGIFRSTDDMATWTRLNNSWNVKDIEFHPTDTNVIYVYENYYWGSNKNKIQKSVNQGVSYTALSDVVGNSNAEINISVSPTCPECIYLISDNGIWNSTDTGANFTTIQNPAPAGISLWYGVPNDTDPTKIVCGYLDMYRSSDSGATFTQATWWSLGSAQHGAGNMQTRFYNSLVYVHADMDYLTCVNGVFYACTDGFLAKSADNGLTWQRLNADTCLRENYNLGISQSNNERLICGAQDNGTTIKTENGWVEFYGADGMEGLIHPLNDDWMIGSVQYGTRKRTFDGGNSNSDCTQPQPGGWVAPILYDTNNQMTIYSFAQNVYRSTEFGNNWVTLAAPATFGNGNIDNAAIAFNNSNRLVASRGANIEMSNDAGVTFSSIRSTLPNLGISDIAFDPNNDDRIIVTYADWQNNGNKVYMTNDAGVTWQNITYNLGNMPVRAVVIENSVDATIYVGTEIGVYKKTLLETSWSMFNASLPNVTVKELEINYGANTIKAATWGRGIWEAKLAGKENYPEIVKTNITSPVTFDSPKGGVAQFVTSNINYAGTISNAKVAWAIDNPNFNATDVIPMYLVTGNTWKSNAPIPDFPVGTKVYFKVIVTGSNNDTSETFKFMYEVKPFDYCAASGENSSGNLRINSFTCGTYTNTTNAYGGYTYYSATPIQLNKGNTYTATGNFNTGWGSNDFLVWIDYNNDGVFSLSEKVVSDQDTGSQGTGNFTVPFDAVSGNVRMRVRLGYWGDYSNACGTTLGEVEDYLVQISDTGSPTLTIQNNANYCENMPFELTYTGSTVDELKWTIQRGTDVYTFTGTTINVSGLPMGQYTIALSAKINGVYYTQLLNDIFEIKRTTWNGVSWSNGVPDAGVIAIINGNYATATSGNIECCKLVVNNGSVLDINDSNYVLVENGITVNGTLNVKNNGSLIQENDIAINAGNINYERTASIRLQDYVYWSSPITGFNTSNISPLTPSQYIYKWNPTLANANGGAGNWINASAEIMSSGKGYIVRGPSTFNDTAFQNFTATFNNGVPNNGVITMPISRGNYTTDFVGTNGVNISKFDDNWNLIGNPYPSAISALDFLNLNSTKIEGAISIWSHNTLPSNGNSNPFYGNFVSNYTGNDYIVYNGTGTLSGPAGFNGFIAGGQGFFVTMNDGATATNNVAFNNSLRGKGYNNNQFYRATSEMEKNRIWLDLTNENHNSDRTLIGYIGGATNEKDWLFDAYTKIESNSQRIYTFVTNDKLSIQGFGLPFSDRNVVPLGVQIPSIGNYSIGIFAVDGLFATQDIFVKDNFNNEIHNIKQSPYVFFAHEGVLDNRFELIFKSELLDNEDFATGNTVTVFGNNSVININASENITEVNVYDVLGRRLYEGKDISKNKVIITSIYPSNQTLFLKIKLENGAIINKKMIF